MLSKRYESTEVDSMTWLHVPSGTPLVNQQWHLPRYVKRGETLTWSVLCQDKFIYQISSHYFKGRLRKVRKTAWTDGQTDGRTDWLTDGEKN